MMTKIERRLLYLLRKAGGTSMLSKLSQQSSYFKAAERRQALENLEQLALVSSAKSQAGGRPGGRRPMVVWLTRAGEQYVDDLIERGAMKDPAA